MRNKLRHAALGAGVVALLGGALLLYSALRPQRVSLEQLAAYVGVRKFSAEDLDRVHELARRMRADSATLRDFVAEQRKWLQSGLATLLNEALLSQLRQAAAPAPLSLEQIEQVAAAYAQVHGDSSLLWRTRFVAGLPPHLARTRLEGTYLTLQADSLRKARRTAEAIATYREAVRRFQECGDKRGELRAQYKLGVAELNARRFTHSVSSFGRSLFLAREVRDPKGELAGLRRMGEVHLYLRQYEESEAALRQSLVLAQSLNDLRSEARARSVLGRVYQETGRLRESIGELERCLQLYDDLGDAGQRARALRRIGFTSAALGDYDGALEAHQASLRLYRQLDRPLNQAAQLTNLGDLYGRLGQHERALEYHRAALKMFEQHGRAQDVATALANIGYAHLRLGKPDLALERLGEALDRADSPDLAALRAEIVELIGAVWAEKSDWRQAKKMYAMALEVNRKNGFIHGRIQSLLGLGQVALGSGELNQAVDYFDRALRLATEAGIPMYTSEANFGKALAKLETGEVEEALNHLHTAIDTIESSRGRIAAERTKLGYFAEKQNIYDAAIRTYLAQKNDPRRAFDLVERAKARSFLDVLRGAVAVTRQGETTDEGRTEVSLRVLGSAASAGIDEVQKVLGRRDRLIEYRVLGDRVAVWYLGPRQMHVAQVSVDRDSLRVLVREFRNAIGAERTDEFRRNVRDDSGAAFRAAMEIGRRLSALLIEPIWQHLEPNTHLYIVPDDILHYLPFAALPQPPPASDRFLIEKAPLATAPSATVLKFSLEKQRASFDAASARVLAVADPRGDLPWARKTGESIARLFPGSKLLLGSEADKERLHEDLRRRYDIVHFGTHGTVDEKSPLYSALHLAAAGVRLPEIAIAQARDADRGDPADAAAHLRMFEVFALNLQRMRLVVLSACETALGRFVRGEGLVGLSRAFMAAGVPTLITTLWKVDDKATARLMMRFYRHLKSAEGSVAQALRQAQLEELATLRDDPLVGYPHPYLWAPFIVVGGSK